MALVGNIDQFQPERNLKLAILIQFSVLPFPLISFLSLILIVLIARKTNVLTSLVAAQILSDVLCVHLCWGTWSFSDGLLFDKFKHTRIWWLYGFGLADHGLYSFYCYIYLEMHVMDRLNNPLPNISYDNLS